MSPTRRPAARHDCRASALGDALVYATGIGPLGHLMDSGAETWRRVFDTNVTGAALVTAATIPTSRRRQAALPPEKETPGT